MKNIPKIFAVLIGFSLLLISAPAIAATFSFSPATVSVIAGETFTTGVVVDTEGTTLYTVRANVSYPPDMLEATAFSFGSGWFPLSQPGYDSVDNTNGVLIKTAGFTGGFSGTKTFGTITFRAKKTGTATITTTPDSLAYNSAGANTATGQGAANATVSAPPVSAPSTPPSTETPPLAPETVSTGEGTLEASVAAEGDTTADTVGAETAVASNESQSQAAAAGFSLTSFAATLGISEWALTLLVLALVLAALVLGGTWWRNKKNR